MKMSAFEREALTQPEALGRLLAAYGGPDSPLRRLDPLLASGPRSVMFIGMGSSLCASLPAAYMLSLRGLPAHAVDAGEYLYYRLDRPRDAFLPVLVSQSGESPEVKCIVDGWKGTVPFVAITNDEASSLAKSAAAVLPLLAGAEASTTNKTYTNTIAAAILMASRLGGLDLAGALASFAPIPDAMTALFRDWRATVEPLADFLCEPPHVDFVGRGPSLATVQQGTLILRELCHIRAAGHTGAGFRHGLVPSMKRGGELIAFAPAGVTDALTIGITQDVVAIGGKVILATNRDVTPGPRLKVWRLPNLPGVAELHMPVLEILLIEMLGIVIAERRGLDPGEGIPKITPKE
ncbi:MAG: SIS domain-containing protein [Candidatus Coatesbacteria bacterium]